MTPSSDNTDDEGPERGACGRDVGNPARVLVSGLAESLVQRSGHPEDVCQTGDLEHLPDNTIGRAHHPQLDTPLPEPPLQFDEGLQTQRVEKTDLAQVYDDTGGAVGAARQARLDSVDELRCGRKVDLAGHPGE